MLNKLRAAGGPFGCGEVSCRSDIKDKPCFTVFLLLVQLHIYVGEDRLATNYYWQIFSDRWSAGGLKKGRSEGLVWRNKARQLNLLFSILTLLTYLYQVICFSTLSEASEALYKLLQFLTLDMHPPPWFYGFMVHLLSLHLFLFNWSISLKVYMSCDLVTQKPMSNCITTLHPSSVFTVLSIYLNIDFFGLN